jgi:CMP-N-acetylneuraminic acid synthetase
LQTIRNSLLDLDATNPFRKNYEDIKTAIQQMGLEYDEYLFQTDLELTTSTNLDNKILPK